ncbi:ABC transporter permease subunit [Pelagicoccus sp. SDUM812003]|uniref:ABC transporter permease subunit n=1 Tax=Pelagicoccus sp. SDUM812003 TaxID=3041267 RepID=UPI00280F2D0E|nr:ABC transporter permease subunit [Pelagicoccus sp. SDUM812003]MDQ8202755.1 ABC transporter permease subunit [Pelagicoccus sp. SDUM812003]
MLADVLCNDRPLYVKFEGESYFPIFAYYPDDLFTGSGLQTRPDYKRISESEAFAAETGNYMVFPPVPYGPFETLEASSIEADDTVWIEIRRDQRVASVNIDSDWTVARAQGLEVLFDGIDRRSVRSSPVDDYWKLSSGMKEAILARLANDRDLDTYSENVMLSNGMEAEASLSPYSVRSREPDSIRVTIRESVKRSKPIRLAYLQGDVLQPPPFWTELSSQVRELIVDKADERMERSVSESSFEIDGLTYVAKFEKEDVHFPFRPTSNHWFGLDSSGRDVLVRILYGLRISLNFGIALVITTMVVGVLVGGLQGYYGGKFDLVGQRFIEIWEALPFLYIMIFMGSIFGQSFLLLLVIYGVFNWIGISYYMRGEFLKLRKQPFVEAARCLGLPDGKIMLRHILPNGLVPVITFFPFSLVGAIFALSALDFLGFGMPPPTPSWGEMLSQAQEFKYAWWLVLYPSLALFVVILLGVFVGEGIRAAFDPRVNSRFES